MNNVTPNASDLTFTASSLPMMSQARWDLLLKNEEEWKANFPAAFWEGFLIRPESPLQGLLAIRTRSLSTLLTVKEMSQWLNIEEEEIEKALLIGSGKFEHFQNVD